MMAKFKRLNVDEIIIILFPKSIILRSSISNIFMVSLD